VNSSNDFKEALRFGLFMLGLAPDTEHFHLYDRKSKTGALSPGFAELRNRAEGPDRVRS
jgi:hypothetical protein